MKHLATTVSIIIPVYNERLTILELIRKVKAIPLAKEIIIVDDGSTDGTRELLKLVENEEGIRVLYHQINMGKGRAIRTAMAATAMGKPLLVVIIFLRTSQGTQTTRVNPTDDGSGSLVRVAEDRAAAGSVSASPEVLRLDRSRPTAGGAADCRARRCA